MRSPALLAALALAASVVGCQCLIPVQDNPCGPWNCAGCCDNNLNCVPGTELAACGSQGADCRACVGAQKCQGQNPICRDESCQGCVTPDGGCAGGTLADACGAFGVLCETCGTGARCEVGRCFRPDGGGSGDAGPPPCGPSTCQGCCLNGVCQPGTTAATCGAGGGACVTCSGRQFCNGGRCDGPDAGVRCGPGTCSGCCTQTGNCVAGSQLAQCGGGGALCQACFASQSCTNNRCTSVTCQGCVTAAGACVAGTSDQACGSAGGTCVACRFNERCQSGRCVGRGDGGMGGCGPGNCPGCCAFGFCLSGNDGFACGRNGQVCAQCPGGSACNAGQCGPPPTDGGAPRPVGAPCASSTECSSNNTLFCLPELAGWPQGYCTATCSGIGPNNAGCQGQVCETAAASSSATLCFQACGGNTACRPGYVCQPAVGSAGVTYAFCRPPCSTPGITCGTGQTCGDAGICR